MSAYWQTDVYTRLGSRLSVSRLSCKLGESLVSLRPLQVVLLFLVRGIPLLCASGWYISNTINNENRSNCQYFCLCNIIEELLHSSTRLPNLQNLPWHQKTMPWTAKHAHHYQGLSHHREAVTFMIGEQKYIMTIKTTKWHYLLLFFTYKHINVSRSRHEALDSNVT